MFQYAYSDLLGYIPTFPPLAIVPLQGWHTDFSYKGFFVPPTLRIDDEFSDLSNRIWLISAPGAVGKSALARKMASDSRAIYLNLAEAGKVGAYYLSGGLLRTNAIQAFQSNQNTLLIDALDEARLTVTDQSFHDFLADVKYVASNHTIPIILFGRSGVIEDTSITLLNLKCDFTIFTIDYFNHSSAKIFIAEALCAKGNEKEHHSTREILTTHKKQYEKCLENFFDKLESLSNITSSNFTGYAPVLQAISAFIWEEGLNFANINKVTHNILQTGLLQKICLNILEREQNKLKNQIIKLYPNLSNIDLYSPQEQLSLLSMRCYNEKFPLISHHLDPQQEKDYRDAINTLLEQHPFLSGNGKEPANVVFGAVILAWILKTSSSLNQVFYTQIANPLLGEFYFNDIFDSYRNFKTSNPIYNASHIVPIFNSYIGLLGDQQTIFLEITEDENLKIAEVSILSLNRDTEKELKLANFKVDNSNKIKFFNRITNVAIDAPSFIVEMLSNDEVAITPPVQIYASEINFNCQNLKIYCGNANQDVVLEAELEPKSSPFSVYYTGDCFTISWPNSQIHPWARIPKAGFSRKEAENDDLHKALLSLSKLVRIFRSHGRGEKRKFKEKLEHSRMEKNFGRELRLQLLSDHILSLEHIMYELDAERLGALTGLNYHDAIRRNFNEKTIDYVSRVLQK